MTWPEYQPPECDHPELIDDTTFADEAPVIVCATCGSRIDDDGEVPGEVHVYEVPRDVKPGDEVTYLGRLR